MLTNKQQAFVEEYVRNGYKGAKAYRVAYPDGKSEHSATNAGLLLKIKKIQDAILTEESTFKMVALEAGVSRDVIMGAIKKMLGATKNVYHLGRIIDTTPDYGVINNAIITYAKLTGELSVDPVAKKGDREETPDLNKMTQKELDEYKATILREL